jgi:hypothetical protein
LPRTELFFWIDVQDRNHPSTRKRLRGLPALPSS